MLTPTEREVLEHARAMGEAAGRASLIASGRSQAIEGPIRITASEIYAAHLLPPIIGRLRAVHPGITVEIVADNRRTNLLPREADIAIRNFESDDVDLIVRKVANDRARPYATPDCLHRLGSPCQWADLAEADFVGFESTELLIEGLRAFGLHLTARHFPVSADSHLVHWAFVRQGLGIGLIT